MTVPTTEATRIDQLVIELKEAYTQLETERREKSDLLLASKDHEIAQLKCEIEILRQGKDPAIVELPDRVSEVEDGINILAGAIRNLKARIAIIEGHVGISSDATTTILDDPQSLPDRISIIEDWIITIRGLMGILKTPDDTGSPLVDPQGSPPIGLIQESPTNGSSQAPLIQPSPPPQAPLIQPSPPLQAPLIQPSPPPQAPLIQPSPPPQAPLIQPSPLPTPSPPSMLPISETPFLWRPPVRPIRINRATIPLPSKKV